MRVIRQVSTCGACITLLVAIAPWAFAASNSASPRRESLHEAPMHVAGFDALVAKEHGFKIVNRDGVQMSIPLRGSDAGHGYKLCDPK
jgi:hypothetical protein